MRLLGRHGLLLPALEQYARTLLEHLSVALVRLAAVRHRRNSPDMLPQGVQSSETGSPAS